MLKTLVFLFLVFSKFCFADAQNFLAIYHTSDIHGWLKPRQASGEGLGQETGGLASLRTLINEEKNPYILLDSGDWMRGAPEGNITKGDAVIDLMNVMKYDAIAIGNHEFDYGVKNLERVLNLSKIPVLAANIYNKNKRVAWAKPYIVIKKSLANGKKIKIGVFSLTTSLLPELVAPRERGEILVKGELESAREAVAQLKKKKVDFIIALTHVGLEGEPADPPVTQGDRFLAQNVPEIDLILGGHTHTITREPIIVNHANGRRTWILHPGDRLKGVTKAVLAYQNKKTELYSHQFLALGTKQYQQDEVVQERINRWRDLVKKKLNEGIGSLPYSLAKSSAPSPVGLWMTSGIKNWAGADAAMIPAEHIKEGLPQGLVTFGDLYFALPLHYRAVKVAINGSDLVDLANLRNQQGLAIFEYSGPKIEEIKSDQEYLLALPSFNVYLDRSLPKRPWKVILDTEKPVLDVLVDSMKAKQSD